MSNRVYTVKEYAEKYLLDRRSDWTAQTEVVRIREIRRVVPHLASIRVDAIGEPQIRFLEARLRADGMASPTIWSHLTAFNTMLKFAFKEQLLPAQFVVTMGGKSVTSGCFECTGIRRGEGKRRKAKVVPGKDRVIIQTQRLQVPGVNENDQTLADAFRLAAKKVRGVSVTSDKAGNLFVNTDAHGLGCVGDELKRMAMNLLEARFNLRWAERINNL